MFLLFRIFILNTIWLFDGVNCLTDDRKIEDVVLNGTWIDDRFDFDPEECNVANGKWIFNHSMKPLYSDMSCPYIDKQFSCVKNGRNDSHYLHWEWQPEDCNLPQ